MYKFLVQDWFLNTMQLTKTIYHVEFKPIISRY